MLNSSEVEPRYHCPVCTEQQLLKLKIRRKKDGEVFLTLDSCQRCGGVWFDKNEVKLSQQITSPKLRQQIIQQPKRGLIRCRDCSTPMDRNLDHCPECGWHNRIGCPVCKQQLQRQSHQRLTLDVCYHCQGVWFDQIELLALWNGPLNILPRPVVSKPTENNVTTSNTLHQNQHNAVTQAIGEAVAVGTFDTVTQNIDMLGPGGQLVDTAGDIAERAVEGLADTPDMATGVVNSLAEVTATAVESVGDLPDMATVVLDVTGDLAGTITEGLAEIIGSLLSG